MHQRQLNFIFDSFQGSSRNTNKDGIILISDENYHILGVLDGVSSAAGAKKAVSYAIKYFTKNHNNFSKEGTFNLLELKILLPRVA
jgi:serine/threonine protein phosphatase PrpC